MGTHPILESDFDCLTEKPKFLTLMTHYESLGVTKKASKEDIRKAYRQKALLFHPDKNPDKRKFAERKFKEISDAYQVLSDPAKRAKYDKGEVGLGDLDDMDLSGTSRPFTYRPSSHTQPTGTNRNRTQNAQNHRFIFLDPNEMFHRFFGSNNIFAVFDEMTRNAFGSDPFMDPFFQDERKMTSSFGNIAGVGSQDYSKPLENPQFSEDAPVLRNDRRKTNQVNIFDPFEQLNKRFENVFNDSFFNDEEAPSRPSQGKNGHFQSYSFASTNINGDEKIMKTKIINGRRNIEKIHNGKVIYSGESGIESARRESRGLQPSQRKNTRFAV